MPKTLGGSDQPGVETDQGRRSTQRERQVGRVIGAQTVRGRQPDKGDEILRFMVNAHRQFAQFARQSAPAGRRRCGAAVERF